jgi:hypothetical protein
MRPDGSDSMTWQRRGRRPARAANAIFDRRLAIAMWQRLLGAEYFPDYA